VVVTVVAVVVVVVTVDVQTPSSALHKPGQSACSRSPVIFLVQSEGTAAEQYGSVSGTPLQSYADVVEDVDVLVVMVVVVVVVVEVVVVVVLVTVVTVVVCVVVVVVDVVSIHASRPLGTIF